MKTQNLVHKLRNIISKGKMLDFITNFLSNRLFKLKHLYPLRYISFHLLNGVPRGSNISIGSTRGPRKTDLTILNLPILTDIGVRVVFGGNRGLGDKTLTVEGHALRICSTPYIIYVLFYTA